jgi:hypothetical protein
MWIGLIESMCIYCRSQIIDTGNTKRFYASTKENLTSPLGVAPPMQVDSKLPIGHVNCAALTHLSHRPLEILIVLPSSYSTLVSILISL